MSAVKEMSCEMYSLEEVIPVLEMLVRRYNSGESSSISYERAEKLMEAVLYTMELALETSGMVPAQKPAAKTVYDRGVFLLEEKFDQAKKNYRKLLGSFCPYGNQNLKSTVIDGLSGFFSRYDQYYAPQNSILTMDYPTLIKPEKTGILAIEVYMEAIRMEQDFLARFPQEYVCRILKNFRPGYERYFFNISAVLLRHVLIHSWLQMPFGEGETKDWYEKLKRKLKGKTREEIKAELLKCLKLVITTWFDGRTEMVTYFERDLWDFSFELMFASRMDTLQKTVVL